MGEAAQGARPPANGGARTLLAPLLTAVITAMLTAIVTYGAVREEIGSIKAGQVAGQSELRRSVESIRTDLTSLRSDLAARAASETLMRERLSRTEVALDQLKGDVSDLKRRAQR